MTQEATDNQLQIVNPSRIERIISKICESSLQVLVKTQGSKPVSIRGRATALLSKSNTKFIRISNISEKGMLVLADQKVLRIEFVGMATQVAFESTILGREQSSILISMPSLLMSLERRKNTRFSTTQDFSCFLKLSVWENHLNDFGAAPVISTFNEQASWLPIADISEGGFCAMSRFPSVIQVVKSGMIDENAQLYLPMRAPIRLHLEIRWIKKLKELVKQNDQSFEQRTFKFGLQYVSIEEEVKVVIRQFMQQLTTAAAI